MSTAANHPPSCQVCRGSGWQRGADVDVHALDGRYLRTYTTAEPCTHHWPSDEYPEELTSLDEYRQRHHDDEALARDRHPSARAQ